MAVLPSSAEGPRRRIWEVLALICCWHGDCELCESLRHSGGLEHGPLLWRMRRRGVVIGARGGFLHEEGVAIVPMQISVSEDKAVCVLRTWRKGVCWMRRVSQRLDYYLELILQIPDSLTCAHLAMTCIHTYWLKNFPQHLILCATPV